MTEREISLNKMSVSSVINDEELIKSNNYIFKREIDDNDEYSTKLRQYKIELIVNKYYFYFAIKKILFFSIDI